MRTTISSIDQNLLQETETRKEKTRLVRIGWVPHKSTSVRARVFDGSRIGLGLGYTVRSEVITNGIGSTRFSKELSPSFDPDSDSEPFSKVFRRNGTPRWKQKPTTLLNRLRLVLLLE